MLVQFLSAMFRCKWKEKPPLSLPGNPSRNWRLFSSCLLVSLLPSFVTIAQLTVNDPLCESFWNVHVQLVLQRFIHMFGIPYYYVMCFNTVTVYPYPLHKGDCYSGNDYNDKRRWFLVYLNILPRLKNGDKSYPFIFYNKTQQ